MSSPAENWSVCCPADRKSCEEGCILRCRQDACWNLTAALKAGILLFNAESESELAVLAERAARLRKAAPVALRVNPDVAAETHPYISTGLRKHKFGVPIQTGAARSTLALPACLISRRVRWRQRPYRLPDHRCRAVRRGDGPRRRSCPRIACGWPSDRLHRRWRWTWIAYDKPSASGFSADARGICQSRLPRLCEA